MLSTFYYKFTMAEFTSFMSELFAKIECLDARVAGIEVSNKKYYNYVMKLYKKLGGDTIWGVPKDCITLNPKLKADAKVISEEPYGCCKHGILIKVTHEEYGKLETMKKRIQEIKKRLHRAKQKRERYERELKIKYGYADEPARLPQA